MKTPVPQSNDRVEERLLYRKQLPGDPEGCITEVYENVAPRDDDYEVNSVLSL